MVAYTNKPTVAALKIIDILKASGLFNSTDDVWYGDSDYIPNVPAATVEVATKNQEMRGQNFRVEVLLDIDIMVYTANMTDDEHGQQLEADQLAESVETELHKYPNLNVDPGDEDLVIHGFVITSEAGYAMRGDDLLRASRLVWRGLSKVRIHP